jgi:pilin isopeptide linkage protein/LPXTG-motif cell wall-anchored protein
MPAGSKDGVKTVQITGNGSYEFGNMYYDEPGEWVYEISEIDDGVKGYTYDTTKYTLTVKVTEDADGDGYLDKTETVTGGDGQIVFTNVYKAEPAPSPKTGDGTATTVALLTLLASAALIGLFGQRRKEQR